MKKITFSADELLIRKARERARNENTTLNNKFREWLENYVFQREERNQLDEIFSKVSYAKPGKSFSRDKLNRL